MKQLPDGRTLDWSGLCPMDSQVGPAFSKLWTERDRGSVPWMHRLPLHSGPCGQKDRDYRRHIPVGVPCFLVLQNVLGHRYTL